MTVGSFFVEASGGSGGGGTQGTITRLSVQAVIAENSLCVSIVRRFVLAIVC